MPADGQGSRVEQPADVPDAHATRKVTLGPGILAVYGSGGMVDAICTFCLSSLLYFYLTAVCGLSGTAAGASTMIALVVDASFDPIVGSISDNSRSRFGRRHPFMLGAAIPIMLALGALFSVPMGLKGLGLFAYATALSLCVRCCLSLFGLPYFALGAELTDDYRKRSTIVAFRYGIGVMGTLAGVILAYGVFLKGTGGLLHRAAYSPLAWSCGVIAMTAALLSGIGTLGVRGRLHKAKPTARLSITSFFGELDEVRRNQSFMVLFGACLLFFIALGMNAAMALHANTFFWKLPTANIQIIAFAGIFGVLIGLPIVGFISNRMEKRGVAMIGMSMICLALFTPVLLRLAGIIPPTVIGAEIALMCAGICSGIGATGATVGFQSMMADAADEHEQLFHARREGLYFAGITFSAKASSGVGTLIAGIAMDAIHFPNDLAAKGPHLLIPADTIRNLGLAYGPGAAMVTFTGVLLLLFYRLNKHSHARILEILSQRRQIDQVPGSLV